MDHAPTAGTLLDAGCAGTVAFRHSEPSRVIPLPWLQELMVGRLDCAGYEGTRMRTAVGLGSNLGDRLVSLHAAREAILELSNVSPPIFSSPVYETKPVDCEAGAGKFLNAVVEFEYQGDPATLLEHLIRIETALGRNRDHPKNVSRIVDIDLLYCGERQIDNGRLQLPHPRIRSRKFVLKPLADIRPDLVLPNGKKTVSELLADFDESGDVVRFVDSW